MFVLLLTLAAAANQPQSPPAASPAEVDPILSRLEQRGNGVKDLRCKLRYTIDDKVNLARLTKPGWILFKRAEPHDVFLIHFETTIEDGVAPKDKREWYLFKDRWLWEVKEAAKTIIKREFVAAGGKVDLFDLDAPFPVPFGQKKDQILRNFEVSLAPPAADDPPNADHLLCLPKPEPALSKD